MHEFHRERMGNDSSSLYTAVRTVLDILCTIDNKCLRSQVADYIRISTNLHKMVVERGTKCKTVDDYCNQTEKGKLCAGQPEVQALAIRSHILIRLVSKARTVNGNINITILEYGNRESTECVYILYDEENQHYDPLYMIDKHNSEKKRTIFPPNDTVISELLKKFIQDEFHYDGFTGLDNDEPLDESELSTPTAVFNESDKIFDLITLNAGSKDPKTRKQPNHSELSLSRNLQEQSAPSTPIYVANQSVDDDNCDPMTIEDFLQKDVLSNDYVSNDRIRFELEPAEKFRGRTNHEFKPKKAVKRDKKTLSKPFSPRYFADQENNHFFNLLIPQIIVLPHAEYLWEVCLITGDIDECSYIHPYFKLQVHPTDKNILNVNPRYIPHDQTKLGNYSEGIQNLILQLVVIMHTNSELMKSEQPLQIFSSLNAVSPIKTIFNTHESFKNAYRLQELRFAVTLWSKKPGEQDLQRHNDIQYISQISTQDKKTKVQKKNTSRVVSSIVNVSSMIQS